MKIFLAILLAVLPMAVQAQYYSAVSAADVSASTNGIIEAAATKDVAATNTLDVALRASLLAADGSVAMTGPLDFGGSPTTNELDNVFSFAVTNLVLFAADSGNTYVYTNDFKLANTNDAIVRLPSNSAVGVSYKIINASSNALYIRAAADDAIDDSDLDGEIYSGILGTNENPWSSLQIELVKADWWETDALRGTWTTTGTDSHMGVQPAAPIALYPQASATVVSDTTFTPRYIGDVLILHTATNMEYRSFGVTTNDWKLIFDAIP